MQQLDAFTHGGQPAPAPPPAASAPSLSQLAAQGAPGAMAGPMPMTMAYAQPGLGMGLVAPTMTAVYASPGACAGGAVSGTAPAHQILGLPSVPQPGMQSPPTASDSAGWVTFGH